MEYNFIELPKFKKQLKNIKTLVDKWIYFIKNAPNLDVIPADVKDEGLKHAYEDADKHSWSKDELHAYDYAAMRKQDEKGKTKRAVDKAIENEKNETVKEFYKVGVSIENIAIATKLPFGKIKQILNMTD